MLPFTTSAGQIVALAAAAGFATGFFRPASYAGLPNLVDADDLPAANSLLRGSEYLSWTIGTAIGGIIVAAAGPDPAYVVNAVTFLVSAALILGIPPRLLQAAVAVSRGHWRDIADGFAIVFRSRVLLAVFFAWNLVMLALAGINVAEVVLAKEVFDGGDVGFGLMWAASGLGLLIGSLWAPRWLELRGIVFVYVGALLLLGFGAFTAALSPNVWVALPCMAIGGIGNGAAVVYNSLLVQRGAPDHLRGRVFTVIMSTTYAMLGLGMVVAGPLTDAIGAREVFAARGRCVPAGARSSASSSSAPRPPSWPSPANRVSPWRTAGSGRASRSSPACAPETAALLPARSLSSRTAIPSRQTLSASSTRRPAARTRSASPAHRGSASRP